MKVFISKTGVLLILTLLVFASCKNAGKRHLMTKLPYSSPEKQGVGTESVLHFFEAIETEGLEIHSFMLIRHGHIIAEAWWSPYKADVNQIVHSISKTFTATAIGFAVDEGLLTVDDPVISFFPDDVPAEVSPYLKGLTIKHLLTMSVGHDSPPVFDITDKNWAKSFLATPIVNEPGTVFSYSSPASYMLSAIIQKASKQTVFDYLKPRLFEPLGMEDIRWEVDAQGINFGGWGLRLKTADMAKLGQLYLQKGKWNGQQLISADWIEEATSVQIDQIKEPTEEQRLQDEGAQGYGYQVWRCTHNAYRADGANGQYIVVMPEQDAVVVVTGNVKVGRRILQLVWNSLLPGMLDKPSYANKDMNEFLISRVSSLEISNPFFTDEEHVVPEKKEPQTFVFNSNDQQIEQVTFEFGQHEGGKFCIRIAGQMYDYPYGLDAWKYGLTDRPGTCFLNSHRNPEGLSPFTIAGYGSWTKPDELSLRLLYLTEGQHETYVCNFKQDQLTLSISNSMQPDEQPVVLTGVLR